MAEPTNLQELLQSNKKIFDETIMDFLPRFSDNKEIQSLYEMMRDYPSRGGKGLRGTICLLWCQLFGGTKSRALLTSSALELFQNWILIHDDIEDGSEMRRGLPALHRKYGVELAINAGDALHGKMWELLLRNIDDLGSDLSLAILSEFAVMLDHTTEGQQMELSWNYTNKWDISEKDYLSMVTKKSAWYTCITPCRLGLHLSVARSNSGEKSFSDILSQIVDFGTHLGIAFQIVDDVLNLVADESKYGKEILGDLYEGKRTLMIVHLLQSMEPAKKERVLKDLSKPRSLKTATEMNAIFQLMKDSGSILYAREVASKHSSQAMKLFDELVTKYPVDKTAFLETRSLFQYLTQRDY
jgi:geranylgeranyl diphosphate synthase, type II